MNFSTYALERMALDIKEQLTRDAMNYRLWQKARKTAPKKSK